MVDVVDSITRSRMMSGIRGKDTQPELRLRHALHRLGLRYRLHASGLPGRPDIVLPKHQAVIFVQGCFWHRHSDCSFTTMPASNTEFWKVKFNRTIQRDKRNIDLLSQSGWRTAIVWECELRGKAWDGAAETIGMWLKSDVRDIEIPVRPRRFVGSNLPTANEPS